MAKKTKVKNYGRLRKMDRDVEKMTADGWRIQSQSGQFDAKPWLLRSMLSRERVTVVWVRD